MKEMRVLIMQISKESVPGSTKEYKSPEVLKWFVLGKAKEPVWLKCSWWQLAK